MSDLPLLAVADLRAAGRQPMVPFRIDLGAGEILEFRRLLRLLPGKRLAGEALWRGRPVFAKLFVADGARRHGERERDGLQALLDAGLPTPAMLEAGPLGGGGYVVLSEFVVGGVALDDQPLPAAGGDSLLSAFALLGRLHGARLIHPDLHLGNFMQHGERLLLIDGDGIRPAASDADLLGNLALLLSQLPADRDGRRREWLQAYGREVEPGALDAAVQEARQRRLRHFLAKTLRNCTEFAVDRSIRHFSVVLREKVEELAALLADPDGLTRAGRCLKDGGTCTVAQADTPAGLVVIKRYNRKGWGHALSRAWRPSRAWHSWLAGHRLAFYGMATPPPLAMIEERLGPLRGRAFLVNAYCPGGNLLDTLNPAREPSPVQQAAILRLFRRLADVKITHGDLKATNLLWHDDDVVLIDLDAMTCHRSAQAFARAWRRDRARLLRNWPVDSVLGRWLDANLPAA
jgi:tRNA A-37 threonylcarbamoyl transferase component Bud32